MVHPIEFYPLSMGNTDGPGHPNPSETPGGTSGLWEIAFYYIVYIKYVDLNRFRF